MARVTSSAASCSNTAEVTFIVNATGPSATEVTLTFSQPITGYTTPVAGITLSGADPIDTGQTVTGVTVNGTNQVVLTLSAALSGTAGDLTVTISESGAAKFTDVNGNGVKADNAKVTTAL